MFSMIINIQTHLIQLKHEWIMDGIVATHEHFLQNAKTNVREKVGNDANEDRRYCYTHRVPSFMRDMKSCW